MISIIIPLYNSEKYILETINSCFKQTYDNFEIIVIDDCSSDASFKIVNEIKDSRLRIFKNELNLGFIATVNKGIRMSKGEYIMVFGNDDILDSNHLKIMSDIMNSNEYSFVYCSSVYIDDKSKIIGKSETKDIKNNNFLLGKTNIINSCGLIIRKKFLDKVGGYPEKLGFKNYGEWYLWLELLGISNAKYTNKINSFYRIHENNLTKSFLNISNLKNNRNYNLECMKLAVEKLDFSFSEKIMLFVHRSIYRIKMFYHIYIKRG